MNPNEIQRSYARYAEAAEDIVKAIAEITAAPLGLREQEYIERSEVIVRNVLQQIVSVGRA